MARTRRQLREQGELAEGGGEAASVAARRAETGRDGPTRAKWRFYKAGDTVQSRGTPFISRAPSPMFMLRNILSTCTARDTQF